MKQKTYIVDIDGVIGKTRHIYKFTKHNVMKVKPNRKIINYFNYLKTFKKAKIIYFTARPFKSYLWTIQWFKKHNVLYDELITNKPLGDYYIDDRNLFVEDINEKD